MPFRAVYAILLVALALCLTPLIAVIWSSWFAERHGCTLHEGFVNECIVNGKDYSETLYAGFVSGWFMLVTLPIATLIVAALAITGVIHIVRRRRKP